MHSKPWFTGVSLVGLGAAAVIAPSLPSLLVSHWQPSGVLGLAAASRASTEELVQKPLR